VRDTTVAARYAQALFLTAQRRGNTAETLADLKGMEAVLAPGSAVARFLASPTMRPNDKRAALRAVLGGRVLPLVAVFVDLLLRKKRLGEFAAIVPQYEALVERAQGVQRAHAVSAVALTGDEQQRLHRELEATTGKKIRLTTEVDPALLGGALVRIGDRVIHLSVKTLLDTVSERLYETSV
jgi:F-type H+-transporting ATPase subunit delta